METIIYKKKQYEIVKIENHPLSFGGGLEIIDNALKLTSKEGKIFFLDGKIYEEKNCNK
jgi:hypothetical protein